MAEEIEKYLRETLFKTIEEEQPNLRKAMKKLKQYLQETNPNREKLYALNNIITQWQRESKQCKSSISWYKLSWSFTSNLKKLQQADHQHQTPEIAQPGVNQLPPPPPPPTAGAGGEANEPYRWSSRLVDPNKVHGLGEKSMFLQRLLVSPKTNTQFKAIGIVGMRGIGKTTLAQLIFGMPEVKSHFVPRIWVCLSKQPEDKSDIRKVVVKRMLICLGVEDNVIKSADDNHGLLGLLFALRLQLTGKRYLVVLDDVWSTEELFQKFISSLGSEEKCSERLAYGLPKGGCGGAVIVTSRAEMATKEVVGGDNVHRLPLTDNVSIWKMFTDTATEGGLELSQPLESLKEIIVRKCGGLPLAAKMMGEIAHVDLQKPPRPQADTAVAVAVAAAPPNESHGGEIGQQNTD